MTQLQQIQVPEKNTMLIQANVQKALAALQAPGGMPYNPSDTALWVAPPPTTMQEALDRISALVKTLNAGHPIP